MIEAELDPHAKFMAWVQGACAVALCLLLFVVASAAQEKSGAGAAGGVIMHEHATGTFDVKVAPEAVTGKTPDATAGNVGGFIAGAR